jgi:hypothetical protein
MQWQVCVRNGFLIDINFFLSTSKKWLQKTTGVCYVFPISIENNIN